MTSFIPGSRVVITVSTELCKTHVINVTTELRDNKRFQ